MRLSLVQFTQVLFGHLVGIWSLFKIGSVQAAVEGHTLQIPGSDAVLLPDHYASNCGILTGH
jgi:hypothetical protein